MSHPFPLLSAVLEVQSDDVIDFIDSHDPDEFAFYESEDLDDDVMDLLDSYESELIVNGVL